MKLWTPVPLLAAGLICGCASPIERSATELIMQVPEAGQRFVLSADVSASPRTGTASRIGAGTEFVVVGRIAEGLVLKPTSTVLTLVAAHMHEAYAVRRDNTLVGYYLPVEHAYAVVPQPVPMPLKESEKK